MVTLKDLVDLEFPRYLHKDGAQQLCADARAAVELIADGWTLRPGEPMATAKSGAYDTKKHAAKKD